MADSNTSNTVSARLSRILLRLTRPVDVENMQDCIDRIDGLTAAINNERKVRTLYNLGQASSLDLANAENSTTFALNRMNSL